MFEKLFKSKQKPAPPARSKFRIAPYGDDSNNHIYNLLFCDDLSLLQRGAGVQEPEPLNTLFSSPPDYGALAALAGDETKESRVRALAYGLLRAGQQEVPAKVLLGTIVEVHLDEGLDTLAAFTDGEARYPNHSGRMSFSSERKRRWRRKCGR